MVANPGIRIHGPGGESFRESRGIDSSDLRVATLTAPNRPVQIGILRDRLVSAFDEFGIDGGHAQACMAIEEALANAIYHGNLELDSKLKEDGNGAFSSLAKERCGLAPWKDRAVYISELAAPFGLWITIRDEGCGFDSESAMQRTVNPESLLASGRGLIMMKAFTDELLFNKKGNEVTLVFYNRRNVDIKDLLKQRAAARHLQPSQHTLL